MPNDESSPCTLTTRCGKKGCWFCDENQPPSTKRNRRREERVRRLINIVRDARIEPEPDDPRLN